jgi:phosphate transport system substrate-binding protein
MSTPSSTASGSGDTISRPKRSNTGMWAAVAVVLIVIILVVVAFEAGWIGTSGTSPNHSQPPSTGACTVPSGQTVTGAGSTFVYPLMYAWSTAYTASTITYSSVGSGTGISDLAASSVNFGASDAPISPAQQGTFPPAAQHIVEMPESAGAVAIIYNLAGVPTLKFTGSVLAQIYLGNITNWNSTELQSVNPGVMLPNAPIQVVHRSDGSGTSFAYTQFLSSASSYWSSHVGYATSVVWPVGTGEKGNGGVSGFVSTTPDTIGYVDLTYALSNGIAYGSVQNPAGNFVLPSLNSTANALKDYTKTLPAATDQQDWYNVSIENQAGAQDYPISTFTYLMAYQDMSAGYGSKFSLQQADALLSFWNWTIHGGQAYSGQYYYVPLPQNIVTADEAELASFTYNGAAVAHC